MYMKILKVLYMSVESNWQDKVSFPNPTAFERKGDQDVKLCFVGDGMCGSGIIGE